MKRLFDLAISLALLLPAGVIVIICAALVQMQSPGPGILRQTRIGRNGAPFTCLKVRTMFFGTPNLPSHESAKSAVTPIGAFLRRSKLDELPQIWNVIKGEMSLVGPRPCLPAQSELIEARRRRGVLALRPGITGPAQVRGIDMSEPELLAEADAQYLVRSGIAEDTRLMLATLFGSGRGDRTKDGA